MCGIVGILAFDDAFALDEPTVARMTDTLRHRGPDDARHVRPARRARRARPPATVDHRPLVRPATSRWPTRTARCGSPTTARSTTTPSCAPSSRRAGHRFRSRTDTEAIVHLYEEEGPACVERLHGMFAFAIWDARRRELLLARDRLGVKPLYYALLPHGLLFGSEIKAILEHPALRATSTRRRLPHYLTFGFTPPPRTMFDGISKLGPAESHDGDGRRARRAPRRGGTRCRPPASSAEVDAMSEAEMVAAVRDRLRESIRKRMMSDVPFGVFLSGGLDSSTNVALMAELTDAPVRTYSTAPRGHARYDELRYARVVARHFGTDHHEVLDRRAVDA